jgi:hypothetical protein
MSRHAVALLAGIVTFGAPVFSGSAAEPSDPVVDGLHVALTKKVAHLQRLLEEKDRRSLAQSATSAELLAQLLKSRGDGQAWQSAASRLVDAAKKVQSAAAASDQDAAAAIKELDAACAAAKQAMPAGNALPPPQAALRPLMSAIDGVYADAKISVMVGKPADAKKGAYVLSELGRLVANLNANNRSPQQWQKLGGLLSETALEAARSPTDDPVEVRVLLRGIAVRCDGCHNAQRQ